MHFAVIAVGCLVVCFVIEPSSSLKGEVCSYQAVIYLMAPAYRKEVRYYTVNTDCGTGSWGRCARKRSRYVSVMFSAKVSGYETKLRCCDGWSSTNGWCNKHNKAPIITYRPYPQTVHRRTSTDIVSWIAPKFREYYNKPMGIGTMYPDNRGILKWGVNNIKYFGISRNNNKRTLCTVIVTVLPTAPTPDIIGRVRSHAISVTETDVLTLECLLTYSMYLDDDLDWFINGNRISQGVSYKIAASDASGYHKSTSTLTLSPTRHDSGSTIECRLPQTNATFPVTLNVIYEVPPVVTYTPRNQEQETSKNDLLIKWKPATFKDPRYGETVNVTTNFGKDVTQSTFTWGKHTVVYTGTNTRNKLSVSTEFDIIVKPPDCNRADLMPIENGALVCGYSKHHVIQACHPVCKANGPDQLWTGQFSKISLCTASGVWKPLQSPINCTDVGAFNPCANNPSCAVGTCRAANISENVKIIFYEKIIFSEFNDVCGKISDVANVDISLIC